MFNRKKIIVTVLCCGLLGGACTRPAAEQIGGEPGGESGTATRVTLSTEQNDISVYAFRDNGGNYLFTSSFHDGWTVSGDRFTKQVDLLTGSYSFLFAKGFGNNLLLSPAQPAANTTPDQLKFVLQQSGGKYGSCDELYLAEKDWTSEASKTIEATLTRAVSRIDLNLRRGFYSPGFTADSDYEPVPYASGKSVLDHISRIEIEITGAGNEISYDGGSGSVTVVHTLDSSDYKTLTGDGFAEYIGPYFIATENDFNVKVTLIPVDGDNYPQLVKIIDGKSLMQNEKLTVNLWLTQLYLAIGVSAETSPISDVREGDSGLWN